MSVQRYDAAFLRRLRNEIPIDWLIRQLRWPNKIRDGRFAFVCPRCGETDSAINRETNLGRCFHCKINFNPIDFTMKVKHYEFVEAVEFLTPLLPR
jgi:DNA primase